MNLKTHSAYPEIMINGDSFRWNAKLIDLDGTVVNLFNGQAENYEVARVDAIAAIESVESDYLMEVL